MASIITVEEALSAYGRDNDSIGDLVAGLGSLLGRMCNREFASRVSESISSGDTITLTVPNHGFSAGQSVSVVAEDGSLDEICEITSVPTLSKLTVQTSDVAPDICNLDSTVRLVHVATFATDGTDTVFIDPRPVSEIVKVSIPDGDGGWEEVDSSGYALSETRNGLSFCGALVNLERNWPHPKSGRARLSSGVKVEFVSGEPVVPPDAVYAMKLAVKQCRRNEKTGIFQSESNEGYSYSRRSSQELKAAFGEVLSTINQLKISVM